MSKTPEENHEPLQFRTLDIARVQLERLYDIGSTIIDSVLEEEYARYPYFGAVHLGRVAMNLGYGAGPFENIEPWFRNDHQGAMNDANNLCETATAEAYRQFPLSMQIQLSHAAEKSLDAQLPVLVFGLLPSYTQGLVQRSLYGPQEGMTFPEGHVLTTDMIDPFSQEVIEDLQQKK